MRIAGVLLSLAILAVSTAGCGGDDSSGSSKPKPSATPKPQLLLQVDGVQGDRTAVQLDPRLALALEKANVTPKAVGDAELGTDNRASFKITDASVKVYKEATRSPFVTGSIEHMGSGLSFTGGGKTVEVTDFVVDPGKSVLTANVAVDGKQAAKQAPLFVLDGSTLKPVMDTSDEGNVKLQGATVKLEAGAAKLLDKTFGTQAFKKDLIIGVATINLNAR